MQVRKAVIPAAGLGTRVLPASKAVPKEMLNIVDKPAIQYIVEEAAQSGITDILIILGRGKGIVEDHFDRAPELEQALFSKGRDAALQECVDITRLANIYYIRQKETKGLGHAVLQAKSFTGDEPFVVLYGDDVIMGEVPVAKQLIDAYGAYGKPALGIKEVPKEDIAKFSSLKVAPLKDNWYEVCDMVEKVSADKALSFFSILGRCLLTPDIYPILEQTQPGAGGEIQLTDAMAVLARQNGMTGVDFLGKRYDMGNKLGIMQAQVETALNHPLIGKEFRAYLKEMAKQL